MKNLILITCLFLVALLDASAQKFTKVASLTNRGEGSVFIANDTVYFLCGLKDSVIFNLQSEMFDANTWDYLGTSIGLNSLAIVSSRRGSTAYYNSVFKTLYLISGETYEPNLNSFRTSTEIHAYSIVNKTWVQNYLSNSEYNRRYGQNAFVNSQGIYIIGGSDLVNGFTDDWVFAPHAIEFKKYDHFWSQELEKRIFASGVVDNETSFYTVGGFDFLNTTDPQPTLVKFNTTSKSSELKLTNDAFKNYGGKAFKLGKYLYFFSGKLKSTMIKYDPATNTFQELPNTLDPTKKYYGGVSFTHSGKVYFGSGYVEDENGNVSFLNDLYEVTEAVSTSNKELEDYTINYLMDERLVSLRTPNNSEKQVEVYDLNGRVVIQSQFNDYGNQISLKGLVPGVYVVKLSASNGKFITKRVVVPS